MDKKPIIAGEIPRLKIEMSPIGNYHLANIEWSVEFSASRGKVVITKQNAEMLTEDSYAVRVDTTNIGTGKLYGILYPSIPDPDVEGGIYTPPVPFDPDETVVPKNYRNGMCCC